MENNKRLIKKNVLLNVTEGAFFMSGLIFFHQMTILVAFIKKIFDSPLLVALIPAIFFIGYNVPGLFTTRIAEQFQKRKKFILISGAIQRSCVLFMALSIFIIAPFNTRFMALMVLFFYAVFTFAGGFGFPAWVDFYAKTVPANLRARTTAYRNAVSGLAGILLPILITVILSRTGFPANYGILFLIGFFFVLLSFVSFTGIRESNASPVPPRQGLALYFSSLFAILKTDKNFREFILIRLIWGITACAPAFYTAYAIDRFHITDSTVALYTLLLNSSLVVGGIILGNIGDKWGNFKVQALGALSATIELILLIFFPSRAAFNLVFFLSGITASTNSNAIQVVAASYGSEENRIRYTTLVSFFSGTAYGLAPVLAGLLLSLRWINMQLLFIICACASLSVLLLYLFKVKEPGTVRKIKESAG